MTVAGRGEGAATVERTTTLALATVGEATLGMTLVDADVVMAGRTAGGVTTVGALPPEPTVVHAPPTAGATGVVG